MATLGQCLQSEPRGHKTSVINTIHEKSQNYICLLLSLQIHMTFKCAVCRRRFASEKSQRSHLQQNLRCAAAFSRKIARVINANIAINTEESSTHPLPMDTTADSVGELHTHLPNSPAELSLPDSSDTSFHAPYYTKQYPEHSQAGHTFGVGETIWEREMNGMDCKNKWGGFANQDEWELARWMMKSGLSQNQIDKFLDLSLVCICQCFIISTSGN